MHTFEQIKYQERDSGLRIHTFIIPKGTKVVPANNLPGKDESFWAEPWDGMSAEAADWQRNIGFLLTRSEVTSASCQCELNPMFCDLH
jgi:hypothetical protein